MTVDGGDDDRSADADRTIGEEQRARVGDGPQPFVDHLEHAELAGGTEAVLHAAQHAQRVVAIALERQHGVDDVLERAGPRERALLRDVPDEQHRDGARLGDADQTVRAVAHLCDGAGRGRELGVRDRLDRIDDDDVGLHVVDVPDDVREIGLGHEPQVGLEGTEPLGAEPHLLLRLLGRHVEHAPLRAGDGGHHLEQQRGLADARLATDQRDRPGHEATAEHVVDLGDAGGQRHPVDGVDLVDGQGHLGRPPLGRGRRALLDLLGQRAPLAAGRAAARPLRFAVAAVAAAIDGVDPSHAETLRRGCDGHGDTAGTRPSSGRAPDQLSTSAAARVGRKVGHPAVSQAVGMVEVMAGGDADVTRGW